MESAIPFLSVIGDKEDGWDAIEHAIAEYDFREGAVPVFVLLQNQEPRTNLNSTLTRDGVLAALESKNVLFDAMVVGPNINDSASMPTEPLFDLVAYGLDPDVRLVGVDADAMDGTLDGQHAYYAFNTATNSPAASLPATTVKALQVSFDGSNTGASGMVGSGKSILLGQNIPGGIGGTAAGDYHAESSQFDFDDLKDHATGGPVIGANAVADAAVSTLLSDATLGSFTFPYYGQNHAEVWINPQGLLTFSSSVSTVVNEDWSDGSASNIAAIAPLWDELLATSSSNVFWKLDGTGASQRLTIQWDEFTYVGARGPRNDTITFQAVLLANGQIKFNYLDLDSYPSLDSDQFSNVVGGDGNDSDRSSIHTGGISATVGLWRGAAESIAVPAGRFVPGLQSINGSTHTFGGSFPVTDTNDSYVRLAWDTGGAAWDLGIVQEFSTEENPATNEPFGIDSPEADALRDSFIESLGSQILRAKSHGNVFYVDDPILEVNVGGGNQGSYVSDEPYVVSPSRNVQSQPGTIIDLSSNSIPGSATEDIFKTARSAGDFLQIRSQVGYTPGAEDWVNDDMMTSILFTTTGTPGIGPNGYGYVAQQVPYTFESITGNEILLGRDWGSEVLDAVDLQGFMFPYFGDVYDELVVHVDGLITLGSSALRNDEELSSSDNADWTDDEPLESMIAVLWENLATSQNNGRVLYEVSSERLVIQWDNVTYFDDLGPPLGGASVGPITFQAVLYADGRIQFNYQDLHSGDGDPGVAAVDDGMRSTVGIAGSKSQLNWSIDIPDGRYDVELMFADIDPMAGDENKRFDVRLDGKTVLNDYSIRADDARIVPFSSVELDVAEAGSGSTPAGVVKRFEIVVADDNGLQIDLVNEVLPSELVGFPRLPSVNGIRIFRADPLPGDYNRDGMVSAADYTIWRNTFGASVTPYSGADGNGDGLINVADYAWWKAHFGYGTPGGRSVFVVPGDYNLDQTVDEADYIVWLNSYGSTTNLAADGNYDGIVDLADLEVWQGFNGLTTLDTLVGDFNSDFVVDTADYDMWVAGDAAADADGDGIVAGDMDDFNIWEANFGTVRADVFPLVMHGTDGKPLEVPGVAPVVLAVMVGGYAFAGIAGSGEQLRSVAVASPNSVSIRFSEEVFVTSGALTVIDRGA